MSRNRVSNQEEKLWTSLIRRITAGKDWWTTSQKPIPKQIWFQRFGVQLREEDFKQEATSCHGFLIRDRTEARIATSGISEFTNTDKEFKVNVDTWPFKNEELEVVLEPGSHILIEGEHKERCEDNSKCSRKFTRRYLLPKGCTSTIKECICKNGMLSITVEKRTTDNGETEQKVPITLKMWNEIKSQPADSNNTPMTLEDPQVIPICIDNHSEGAEPSTTAPTNGIIHPEIAEPPTNGVDHLEIVEPSTNGFIHPEVAESTTAVSNGIVHVEIVEKSKVKPIADVSPDVVEQSKVQSTAGDSFEEPKLQ